MDKIKWRVLEPMEWRDKSFKPGDEIVDTENGYMKAMAAQGKCEKA
ncbi:MAG: hypothetical protein TYPL_3640 [Candidatus Tyloplasma litorale]|nr:MAG: hypothetical protein TYPL_3640 [Mycoplasmatales bacterium]